MGAPGCDDAPLIEVPLGNSAKSFTLIMPYYENPKWFRKQVMHLEKMWQHRRMFETIVVDDGSPDNPAKDVLKGLLWPKWFKMFRLEVDIRWNWLAARNIGAHHANDGWLLLTDIDHVLPPQTLDTLVLGRHDPSIIYRFSREEHTGEKIHPHPNSWFMTKEMYWKIGGYDERMVGYYGSDGYYRRRCAATAPIRIMTVPLIRHEFVDDSSTSHYKRKQPEDAKLRPLVRSLAKGLRPKVLSFPYHEIFDG